MRALSYLSPTMAMTVVLLVMAAWRWHEAAVTTPDRIGGIGEPSAVLLVQERDCPDRRAAMIAWLTMMEAEDSGLVVYLGTLDGDPKSLDPELAALPRIGAEDLPRATRAVLRSGVPGTPALIVLDQEGRVLLTDTFATDGPGPRLALAASLLPRIAPSASDGTHELDGR